MPGALKSLVFDEKDLFAESGVIIQSKTEFSAPARDVTSQAVPGRSGNLLLDNGRYQNRALKYTCVIAPWWADAQGLTLSDCAKRLKEILLTAFGYKVLRTDYNPGYFYRAAYTSALDVEEIYSQTGKISLAFDAMPFMYSDAGQEQIAIDEPTTTIINPEGWESRPQITISGSGDVEITITNATGGKTYHLLDVSPGMAIDAELMEVYLGGISCNNKMTTPEFPVFAPGENAIQWSGEVQGLQIIPRWCCL
jgi:phage-related protein